MLGSTSIVGIEGLNMLKEMGNQNTSGIIGMISIYVEDVLRLRSYLSR